MPDFAAAVRRHEPILADGGIETRVMFETDFEMDPDVQVAAMVGDDAGRGILERIYGGYVAAGKERGLPVVIGTPTFRASANFVRAAGRPDGDVERLNRDAAELHWAIRAALAHDPVFIAGVLGPSGDVPRLGELKANGSPLPTDELITLDHPEADEPETFAAETAALLDPNGLHILGGCCGTNDAHIRALAARLTLA